MRSDTRQRLLVALARARRWLGELSSQRARSLGIIAAREGCSERYVRAILPLAFLAPALVRTALEGRLPEGCGVSRLVGNCSPSWREQLRVCQIGIVPLQSRIVSICVGTTRGTISAASGAVRTGFRASIANSRESDDDESFCPARARAGCFRPRVHLT
jgi:hypothetical protein